MRFGFRRHPPVFISWREKISPLSCCISSTVKPRPPVNLSHVQTIDGELILQWDGPALSSVGPLRYEVRHSANATHPSWQVTPGRGGKKTTQLSV